MEYDCIFDFSASPAGGGLRRLLEYTKYFQRSKMKVLFLARPSTAAILSSSEGLNIDYLPRPALLRIIDDAGIVAKYRGKAKCFFSYGIPIYKKMSSLDWMHISNALPFAYKSCSVSAMGKIKNNLLLGKFKKTTGNPDIVSAESQFSLDLYASRCGTPKESILLRNGSDIKKKKLQMNETTKLPVALIVGVERYKRVEMAVKEFERMRALSLVEELVIVGNPQNIPAYLHSVKGVRITGFLPTDELDQLYATSKYYISASEIENSSIAVMEALAGGAICILSRIPSHLEMFELTSGKVDISNQPRGDFFIAQASMIRKEQNQSWNDIIDLMCKRMGFKLA